MELCFIDKGGTRAVPVEEVDALLAVDNGLLWINFDHTDDGGMGLLTELVDVREVDIEDCRTRTPVPKIHLYGDHMFSAINGVARGTDGRLYFQPLKVFLNDRLIVTVLGPTNESLTREAARHELAAVRLKLDAREFRPATGLDLITAIRFEMLHTQEELTGAAARRIAALERRVMQADPVRAEALLHDLVGLRHDLQTIGTNAAQTYESYTQLHKMLGSQDGLLKMDRKRIKELRQAFRHLKNTTDLEREYLQEMLDLFQTRASTELNKFVRQITAWGTIGIAWTCVAGVYGMNFAYMPELQWAYGYPFALGLMAAIGILLAIVFRRKGWM